MDWRRDTNPLRTSFSRDFDRMWLPTVADTQRYAGRGAAHAFVPRTDAVSVSARGAEYVNSPVSDSCEAGSEVKHSLGFILNDAPTSTSPIAVDEGRELVSHFANMAVGKPPMNARACETPLGRPFEVAAPSAPSPRQGRTRSEGAAPQPTTRAPTARSSRKVKAAAKKAASTTTKKTRTMTYEERRLARKCTIDGCFNYTINKGLCFRHGGGKQCTMDGCDASAKVAGLCWKHGGSVQCNVKGCDRRGKSRGLCWAHGGGTKCQADTCEKVAVSNGFCWAHGGGKRCLYDGCQRPAYERTFNYCPKHYKRYEDGEEAMEV